MTTSPAPRIEPESDPRVDLDTIIIGAGISGLYQLHRVPGARPPDPGVRGGDRRGRHLVLEPVSGLPLRLGELLLRLLIQRRAAGRMGLDRALRGPARDRALPEPRRRHVRPAPRHPVQEHGAGRRLRRGPHRLGDRPGGRPPLPVALSRHRGGPAVGAHPAPDPRHRGLRGRGPPHRALAQARGQLRREAGGRDRRRGATGVQAIQEIAKTAGHLTVFQRRPNWCTPLHNRPIAKAEMDAIRKDYPALFQRCRETAACFLHTTDPRGTFEVTPEERLAFWETLYASPGFAIWLGNFRDVLVDREANQLFSDFVADKTHYYEVYNQPNVELVSILDTPIERITRTGVRTSAREFELDILVFATGFDAITGSFDRIDIRGVGGQRLKDRWQGGPATFVGVMVDGFANLFMVMDPHTALGNIPRSIEYNVEWIRDLLDYLGRRGLRCADARPDAVAEWTAFVKRKGQGLLANEVDSWMTGVNMNVEGKQVRIVARYSGTAPEYRAWCDRVAAGGYRELVLR